MLLRKPSRRPSGHGARRASEAESERNFLAGEIDSVFSKQCCEIKLLRNKIVDTLVVHALNDVY